MKKKIIYIFVFIMFLIVLFSTTVSAKSISAKDIENRTYIIGEHMYTRDTNGDYAGRLTTQYIMLGSSTIDSKDLGDFIIYYKNPLGEWKDALTNQTVTAPETFDIKYTNGQQSDKVQYGDANCDGEINATDCTYIMRYLKEYENLEDFNIANADVNGDGSVTEADYKLIGKYIAGYYPEANLPEEPLGETYKIECIVDGQIYNIEYELRGEKYSRLDSPEKEGYRFNGWYLDEEYKRTFSGDKVLKDITLYGKFEEIQYGDVNSDGILDYKDLVRMQLYLEGEEIYAPIENADVNGDGKFTISDYMLFMKYLLNCYPEANLPQEPLGKTCMIEYVLEDGNYLQTYAIDYELNGHTISSSRKPKDPEMDGYIFEGWYDLESDEKFEFGTTLTPQKARDLILCAKFVKIGDVDNDGDISLSDAVSIAGHLRGIELLTEPNISYGDVNKDGELDDVDLQILAKFITDPEGYGITKLPYDSGEKYKISYNLNGGMQDERNITTYAQISLPFTLEVPTKEGYVFTGWTGSNGTTPQTEVTIEKGRTGKLEYTAN